MKRYIKIIPIALLALTILAAVIIKWSFMTVNAMDPFERCVIITKIERGERFWDKNWFKRNKFLERKCEIDILVKEAVKVIFPGKR